MDEYLIGLIGDLENGPIAPGDWLPAGGNSGDVLAKNSDANYDAGWYPATELLEGANLTFRVDQDGILSVGVGAQT